MTHILMIEDEHNILEEVLEWFEFENYQASGASNGREGVEKALALHPDLILCDVTMPVMNGYDFIKAVRAQPKYARLTMMMVTTETEMSQVVRALAAGANEYVMKPFTADALVEKLELLGLL